MQHANILTLKTLAIACLLLTLGGCVQRKDTVTLNPDGSGKAVVDVTLAKPPMPANSQTANPPDPAIAAQNTARTIIVSSRGVDAWKDVAFDTLPDGRTHFSGTAYFPDIARFELQNAGKIDVTWKKSDDGTMTLAFKIPEKPVPKAVEPLTEKQIQAKIDTAQDQWNKSLPIITSMLESLRLETTYVLPGKIEHAAIFKPVDHGVSLVLDGGALLAGMKKIMADREGIKRAIDAGREAGQTQSEEVLMEKLFGTKARAEVRVSGATAPLFDYPAESAAAKAAQPAMVKSLGLD